MGLGLRVLGLVGFCGLGLFRDARVWSSKASGHGVQRFR